MTNEQKKPAKPPAERVARVKPVHPVTGDDGLVRPPWAATDLLLKHYYDTEWGMPIHDERVTGTV